MYLWQLLFDRLTGICCDEVKQVLVTDTIVLICTVICEDHLWDSG